MKNTKVIFVISFCIVLVLSIFKLLPYITSSHDLLSKVSFSTAIFDKNNQLLRLTLARDSSYRVYVPIENISDEFKRAVILYEDRYFYYHFGFNPASLLRGLMSLTNSHERPLGGSTITMQLARVKYAINSKTISGKIHQILKAVYLELKYTKNEILEAYLNIIPYGHNISGVEAAAHIYFNTSSEKLTLSESLLLAVIPQNPTGRTPTNEKGLQRAKLARDSLFHKWIAKHPKDTDAEALFNMPISINTPSQLPFHAPHFTDRLLTAGYKGSVVSSLDMDYQKLLENKISEFILRNKLSGIYNAAALLVNYKTMDITAYVGSANYFNNAIEGQVDGIWAKRSPGSVLKPFIYALAIEQGLIHPKSMLKDSPRRFGAYSPENSDSGFMGPLKAYEALVYSRNIPAIDLLININNPSFYDLLKDSGIKLKKKDFYGSALAIGGFEASAFEIATLYCALANMGELQNINFLNNSEINSKKPILSPEASFLTLEMLGENPPPKEFNNIKSVYWKTGTSFAYRDAWSAGVFGDYVLVVWVGNFNGEGNLSFTGRGAAAPLFFNIVAEILTEKNITHSSLTPNLSMNIKLVDICSPTGDLPGKFCPTTEKGWFIPGVSPIKVSDVFRQIPIDKETGLRACIYDKNTTYLEIYEFWPADIYDLFVKSGIYKRKPPRYMPDCNINETAYLGLKPQILMPSDGTVYSFSADNSKLYTIPFSASSDSDAEKLYWFINGKFIGSSKPNENFFWNGRVGSYQLTVSDDFGRTASVNFMVETIFGRDN